MTLPESEWDHYGWAGHFICSDWCQFHLTTQVGRFLVSTVGAYLPDEPVREILANSRNITLVGKGDERRRSFLNQMGYVEVGADRTFETMVFEVAGYCEIADCPCGGMPNHSGRSIDFRGYKSAVSADRGHWQICQKWAGLQDWVDDDDD